MAPSEWNQVVELFHAALDESGDERAVLLDQACGVHTLLRKTVDEMLREHESASDFLSDPLLHKSPPASCPDIRAPNQRFAINRNIIVGNDVSEPLGDVDELNVRHWR